MVLDILNCLSQFRHPFLLPVLLIGLVFVGYSTKWWWWHRAGSDIWVSFDPLDPLAPHSMRTSKSRVERERNSLLAGHFVPRWSSRRIDTAHVEMTIKYNGLQPENDLSSPSQLVPFAAGIANSIDSVLYLVGPYKKRRPEVASTPKPSSASSLPPARPEGQGRHDPEGNLIHISEMQREDRVEHSEAGTSSNANV
jgi:hypothetical protein